MLEGFAKNIFKPRGLVRLGVTLICICISFYQASIIILILSFLFKKRVVLYVFQQQCCITMRLFIAIYFTWFIFTMQLAECFRKLRYPPISSHYGFIFNQSLKYSTATFCRQPGYKSTILEVRSLFFYIPAKTRCYFFVANLSVFVYINFIWQS